MNGRRRPSGIGSATLILALTACLAHVTFGQSAVGEAGPAQAQAVAAEAGIREMLQRYSAALESLDANAVKKVQPSIPVEHLMKAFSDMRELKVAIDAVRVLSGDASTARVSCRVTQTLTPKVGSRKTTAVTRVIRLRRDADSWVIDGFER